MKLQATTRHKVLFGNELHYAPSIDAHGDAVCVLGGYGKDSLAHELSLTESLLSKHVMMLGGIGTGKTNTFFQIVSQLKSSMSTDDVMIVFDTKGDFYKEFYCPSDVVISNDETATGADCLDYWNIFNEIDSSNHETESIIEIAKAVFAEACERTNQVFFPNAAKDLFMATLLHFVRSVPPYLCTNKKLIEYINFTPSNEFREMLMQYPDLRAMSSYIAMDDSAQTQGVMSELQQVTREVFIGHFAKTGTLSLRDLVKRKGGKTVFIEYDLSIGKMLSPIYSLMFDLAIKEALGRKRTKGNVYFITDEFRLLPHLTHIDDAVNFGRSMGIKFLVGVQNVEQIYDNYGEERARSILSGFSTSIIFRLSDEKSREYAKGIFGKNRKQEVYMPIVQTKGLVEELREGNVVEDWDITNLKTGEAIIGFPEQEPFLFKFNKYTRGAK